MYFHPNLRFFIQQPYYIFIRAYQLLTMFFSSKYSWVHISIISIAVIWTGATQTTPIHSLLIPKWLRSKKVVNPPFYVYAKNYLSFPPEYFLLIFAVVLPNFIPFYHFIAFPLNLVLKFLISIIFIFLLQGKVAALNLPASRRLLLCFGP